jgi:hypothetical protein
MFDDMSPPFFYHNRREIGGAGKGGICRKYDLKCLFHKCQIPISGIYQNEILFGKHAQKWKPAKKPNKKYPVILLSGFKIHPTKIYIIYTCVKTSIEKSLLWA